MDDLGILPTEFHDTPDIGVQMLHGDDDGIDLLDECRAQRFGQGRRAGTGDVDRFDHPKTRGILLSQPFQYFQKCLRLLRSVCGVVFRDDLETLVA